MTRLDEVGRRYGVPPDGVEALRRVLELQAVDPTASTTVRDVDAVRTATSPTRSWRWSCRRSRARGGSPTSASGAGWPGLALAAALPEARVALVESAIRHCRYLERAVAAGALANVEVVHARAEEWPAGLGAHDLVTARAVAALPVLCEYAAPLLAEGGALVAWKGAVPAGEAAAGRRPRQILGLERGEVRARGRRIAGAERRTLHVFRKIAPTPERYPRRAGDGGQAAAWRA